jgi:hypothetical protein
MGSVRSFGKVRPGPKIWTRANILKLRFLGANTQKSLLNLIVGPYYLRYGVPWVCSTSPNQN